MFILKLLAMDHVTLKNGVMAAENSNLPSQDKYTFFFKSIKIESIHFKLQ